MYRQNKTRGMKNSGRINKPGFNSGGINKPGGYYSRGTAVSNHGRMNKNFGNQPFVSQDVTKLKQLCTVTNEWIQQKSSELLDVLRRTDGKGGDVSHRTVTVQSKMNFDHNPPAMFDRSYNDNPSEVPNRDYNPVSESRPANMNYEQNRERYNQEEITLGSFKPNRDVAKSRKPNDRLFSVIQKMKMYLNDKIFSINNAAKLFVDAARVAGAAINVSIIQVDEKQYRFDVKVENVPLAFGSSYGTNDKRTLAKKQARTSAYMNALKRLKGSNVKDICGTVAPSKSSAANPFLHQAIIEPDPKRHISTLVVRETKKIADQREKNAMLILRRSVFFSKMIMHRKKSMVGNVHKAIIYVQNIPLGIGFGSSVTKSSMNAAADALFNNLYRKNPVIQTLYEEDSHKWIHWTNIKFLANEMERIGGHSLISGQNISNRSFATAIKKLVDNHPWNEVDNELMFGPGMSLDCAKSLSTIAKERNLNLEEKKHPEFGTYYIIKRYYDPIDIVRYLQRNGGQKGKYRLVERAEIPQIQCDHWEPSSQVWNEDKVSQKVTKSKVTKSSVSFSKTKNRRRRRVPKTEANDRNVDNSSVQTGRAFNNGTFSNKQRMPINDGQPFPLMSDYEADEFDVLPHSKDKYLTPNNDGRFNQKFTQDKEMCGFNDGEFRHVSRSDNDFRPMSDSYDREPKQMSWTGDKGFGQMSQPNDRGFGQRHQPNSEEFEQSCWLDNREFRQVRQSDDVEFGQMSLPDNREFRQVSQTNIEEPNQPTWHDRREYKQELSRMPGSHDREYRETSRPDSREFGRMQSLEEREFNQLRGHMERGISDDFDKEFNSDKTQRLGHDERRFNAMYDYTGQDFKRISDNKEREFNSQFRSNEGNREHMHRTYDDNYKHLPDVNKERIGRNTYENKLDKLSVPSDIGMHHSSNYERFNFDKPTSEPDNRHYNQLLLQNKRDYDKVSCVDDNRLYTKDPNYDDRRFNNEPQFSSMDRQNNQINQDNMMGTNRMQNNGPWNKMQDPRGEDFRIIAENSRMYRPNNPMPCGPTQRNNMMMQQNMMTVSQDVNKNQLTALRFLTKKIAHTALHANVKSILANARRLSNIARARSRVEKSTVPKPLVNTKKPGKGNEVKKIPLSEIDPKAAYMLQLAQSSKGIKKTNEGQSSNRRVSSQNKNAKQK